MNVVFADTSYFIALVGEDDEAHDLAVEYTASFQGRIVTTGWVLMELANHLAEPRNRPVFLNLLEDLKADSRVTIVEPTGESFESGVDLYRDRMDKGWSLVDCISFQVMEAEGIMEPGAVATGERRTRRRRNRATCQAASGGVEKVARAGWAIAPRNVSRKNMINVPSGAKTTGQFETF